MNIENTRQKCYSILNPNPRTVQYVGDSTVITTLVRTNDGGGYISLTDIAALDLAGDIEVHASITPDYVRDYGRTVVNYSILRRPADR